MWLSKCFQTVFQRSFRSRRRGKQYTQDERDFLEACRTCDMPSIKRLVGRGVDVNTEGKKGHSVLMLAAKCGHSEAVEYLLSLDNPPDIHHCNQKENNALMMGAWKGYPKVCEILLSNNPPSDIHHGNNKNATALTLAAQYGQSEVVKALLSHQLGDNMADIHHQIHNGKTALILASRLGHTEVVQLLLDHSDSPDINHINHNRYNALMLASKFGHEEVIKLLLQTPKELDIFYVRDGMSSLDWAIMRGHFHVAALVAQVIHDDILAGFNTPSMEKCPKELILLIADFTCENPAELTSRATANSNCDSDPS